MASKIYVSAVPLTMVRLVEGGYLNVLQGDPIPGEAVQPDDLKRLVRKGFLKEAEAPAQKGADSAKEPTVPEILEGVGDDKEKAAAALEQEKAGKNRKTLVEPLEAILAKD